MNTRILMIGSAAFMGLVGIVLTFMPQEVSLQIGQNPDILLIIVLQLLGAIYFGFAMTNWMAKGALIGGIYARPLSIGNFTHFFVGGLALSQSYVGSDVQGPYIPILASIYLIFGISFGYVFLTHPKSKAK